ncbi:3-hydroxyacyl-CoA dehydrogenase NAD-binding domain-containing protein [Notoacmeibacter sp. MSK16QG-6]|uniref:3-hydroxyacyl-CoA dehydrogenase NAD-binding domain-containing protein n=1 Tax=Notoacmeibacter sp. MSK16QG-6 TaxID=2957982 RepID=UPI00209F1711|nr:3-hydroxyacyl-CoA dehydrogenase NAD-binding domain-containing protein [Notoacmeibacter sp. MSK16QG-6]MCP1198623.1 3-hydroxyacyl-CoA dehydrogenase NAD-binding domain-containing protein [Notoacmeibacter sp. MSK16QG-6]
MTDYKNFTVETDSDGIVLVTWDMPDKSMNVFTEEVMDEIETICDATSGDESVKGVIFTSGKTASFSGGADLSMLNGRMERIQELKQNPTEEGMKELFEGAGRMSWLWRKIETNGKPWVAAINGTCMGGATELALSCHYRVAADSEKVKIALPEVKVGIFPGAGGTQRVPRLIDTQEALKFMTTGSPMDAAKAQKTGLIHEVAPADELIDAAKAKLRAGEVDPEAPWDKKKFKAPGTPVYSGAGSQLWPPAIAILRKQTYGNYPAAEAILKCVFEGLQVPIDTGLTIEQRYFTEILRTTEAAMMVRSLFISLQELNKGARRPDGVEKSQFKKVGVLGGGGFMGAGIGYVTAKAGIDVVLLDRDSESAEKGRQHAAGIMDGRIKKRRATESDKEELLSRITTTADYADLEGCDLIVEAVFEDSGVKKAATESAEAVIPDGTVFASNTSTIPISSLAENSKKPDQFIGIHFFSPVDKMMLVEIILGEKTGEKALATAIDYVRAIGKTPIVVNDTRGFYVNRCVLRYISEAYNMLVEGIPPAMIENAAKMAGMPVGPLALNDETAIDLSQKIMRQTARDLGDDAIDQRHMKMVDELVEKGRLGRKAGKGFYDYPEKPAKKHLWPGLKEMFDQKAADTLDVGTLEERFLFTIAIEAARVMEEGIVEDPREADVGSILAFGFAPYSGGALSYIDGFGVEAFVERANELKAEYGEQFAVPELLRDMASKDQTFYERFPVGQKAA